MGLSRAKHRESSYIAFSLYKYPETWKNSERSLETRLERHEHDLYFLAWLRNLSKQDSTLKLLLVWAHKMYHSHGESRGRSFSPEISMMSLASLVLQFYLWPSREISLYLWWFSDAAE